MKKQLRAFVSYWIGWFFVPVFLSPLFSNAIDFPGREPGIARSEIYDNRYLILTNDILSCTWSVFNNTLRPIGLDCTLSKKTISLEDREIFCIELSDGTILRASEMKIAEDSLVESLQLDADPDSPTLANRFPGQRFEITLNSVDRPIKIVWRAELRDGSNSIRQTVEIVPTDRPCTIKEIRLIDVPSDRAVVGGTVPGSPLLSGNFFFAYEHPNSEIQIDTSGARCILTLNAPLQPGIALTQSSAMGVVPEGQRRRGFLYYIERERAHPYRPFLHYNSWYDICWGNLKINEKQCLKVIDLWGRELVRKRNVPLASFVWDDGWDDPKTLWRPVADNFPNGFSKMVEMARSYDTRLGFWLSPFGGYGKPAQDRYDFGREQGFEFNGVKFALAGPKYYARFLETCSDMIQNDGANFFKFDGLTRDITESQAMLRLTRDLRKLDRDLFISITTGTWPSPYWLWFGDSTWRGGRDMGFHGAGSKREQWITYRDMVTYKNVVRPAPLYPLNSLMNQGVAMAHYGSANDIGTSVLEFRNEVRSFFACGTCLQELYISPDLMTSEHWDDLAECAKWSQANADVLVDTHWIGGDPEQGEPYGWASWSKRKGIIGLRNPSDYSASITVDIGEAFEFPLDAPKTYRLKSPWNSDKDQSEIPVEAGKPYTFQLQPFQVFVFDAWPD